MTAQRTPVRLSCGPKSTDQVPGIYRGDAWALRIRLKGLGDEEGEWEWKSQIAKKPGGEPLATCDITESTETVETDDGDRFDLIVDLLIDGDTTAGTFPASSYAQDFQRTPAGGGDPETLFRWSPVVSGQVTT